MVYKTFLHTVQTTLQERLGANYTILVQKIPKNNGTDLDGLCISKIKDRVAPTIYLNAYFEHYQDGIPFDQIIDELIELYTCDTRLPQIDPELLAHFDRLRDKVAYKLIHTKSNEALLTDLPHIPYMDLSIVFYLFLEENEYGHMTVLIHHSHLKAWGSTIEELYALAKENTPRLLPISLKNMLDVLKGIAKEHLGDDYREEFVNELISPDDQSPLYVLSNTSGLNGACTILYEQQLKSFADLLEQDLVILPSSIHEVLLVPYEEELCFEELASMVQHINQTEVPQADQLSNQIYYYSRIKDQVSLVQNLPKSSQLS
ncbi:MAG: DUF5688 family protein [Hungatella sp.]